MPFISRILLIVASVIVYSLTPWVSASLARVKSIERDMDNDGIIDQVAHVDDRGNLVRLEIDTNADGAFEKVQFYHDGQLVDPDIQLSKMKELMQN